VPLTGTVLKHMLKERAKLYSSQQECSRKSVLIEKGYRHTLFIYLLLKNPASGWLLLGAMMNAKLRRDQHFRCESFVTSEVSKECVFTIVRTGCSLNKR